MHPNGITCFLAINLSLDLIDLISCSICDEAAILETPYPLLIAFLDETNWLLIAQHVSRLETDNLTDEYD